jgi:hypothetical protein
MDTDTTTQLPQPTDPSGDEIADTGGHSMLTPELVRATQSERSRQAEQASRERARARDARPGHGRGILDRLRGR